MIVKNDMDPYVALARRTIEGYVSGGHSIEPPTDLPVEMREKQAGVFVSLHRKSDHSLRGCIGTFAPTKNSIAHEIIQNAIAAATEDPRFTRLAEGELDNLEINVDVLSEPEPIKNLNGFNAKKFGLIVRNQTGHTGLLLPDIGVGTAEEVFNICCQKGGINPATDTVSLFRFTVERHS